LAGAALGAGATEGLEGAEKELDLLALEPELNDELERPPPERPIEPASATVATIAVATTTAENSLENFIKYSCICYAKSLL
jgi:hypothetical protein